MASSSTDQKSHNIISSSSSSSSSFIEIDSSKLFDITVEKYLDDNKPDELCRRQMKSWSFAWNNHPSHRVVPVVATSNNSGTTTTLSPSPPRWWESLLPNHMQFTTNKTLVATAAANTTTTTSEQQPIDPPTKDNKDNKDDHDKEYNRYCVLTGVLTWKGTYMIVYLEPFCGWKYYQAERDDDETTATTTTSAKTITRNKSGSLLFSCRAWGEFIDASSGDNNKRNHKHQMIQRLQQDSYLQSLTSASAEQPLEICEANILVTTTGSAVAALPPPLAATMDDRLEERVHWNEATVEAIRRAVFSQAESTLDVLDLILSFPFLPTTTTTNTLASLSTTTLTSTTTKQASNHTAATTTKGDSSTSNTTATTTMTTTTTTNMQYLASRAKLRLLEDAMYDACEQEDEEELVEELHISKKAKT